MKAKPLPDQSTLLACLEYNSTTGELYWKVRPEWTFPVQPNRSSSHIANAWNAAWAGKPALNSVAKNGYLRGTINGVFYYTHRVIWKILYGTEPDDIDHEDGNRKNNKKDNLFDKNREGNLKNRCLSSNNTSGYHGISYFKRTNQWTATIYNKGKAIHFGYFNDKQDAIDARKIAEKKYGYHPNHGRNP